jgi:hypothetical protein
MMPLLFPLILNLLWTGPDANALLSGPGCRCSFFHF